MTDLGRALSPREIEDLKPQHISPIVFEKINELLVINLTRTGEAQISKPKLIALLKAEGITFEEIVEKGWFNFSSVYEDNGWNVSYYSPSYDEAGEAHWTFKAKQK